jgi:hypothetical protein
MKEPGTVAQVCNLSYSEGWDQEDHGWRPAWAWWYLPVKAGSIKQKVKVQASQGKKWDPVSQITRVSQVLSLLNSKITKFQELKH